MKPAYLYTAALRTDVATLIIGCFINLKNTQEECLYLYSIPPNDTPFAWQKYTVNVLPSDTKQIQCQMQTRID